ncbi:ubiquitin carboxyl-terminal hydrolase CYLD isoform X2 [Hippocampus comes]|uniref:ubiquitin carboxyl-terminal hydrolase CYLD isoform X2 n=1 Tax=Hippocampus comes TaxID=109280 RepID=UPI00094E4D44|nr:PREDICTED: ubiquitin carboxyl-terminal hydrolase CYLD-like isoform X2 [Hippocampus comes]
MSGAHDHRRKLRPPKIFLLSAEQHVQGHSEGTIVLPRGSMCSDRQSSRSTVDFLYVKMLELDIIVQLDKRVLVEVPTDCVGLLEPVAQEARLELLRTREKLHELAKLPAGTPLWVRMEQVDELAEAELKYVGPLTPGSRPQYFGVQLKGSAAGKGKGTGGGLFTCPDGCAVFLPVSHIKVRHWSSGNEADDQERKRPVRRSTVHNHHSNNRPAHVNLPGGGAAHHVHVPLTTVPTQSQSSSGSAEEATTGTQHPVRGTAWPLPYSMGQRVTISLEGSPVSGEVRFCGPLPRQPSSSIYVGVLLDTPTGNWDGHYRGEKLCQIPSALYGKLLPVSKVSPESKHHAIPESKHHAIPESKHHAIPAPQVLRSILKTSPPATKPAPALTPTSASKVALLPPTIKPPKPVPPPPPPKPFYDHLPLPPPPPPQPPPKPADLAVAQHTNGTQAPPSPPGSPDTDQGVFVDDVENLEVGSMVEVNNPPLYGVIRWIGHIEGVHEPVAGIELEQEVSTASDGTYLGERHFHCPPNKGLFVKIANCRRDSRFPAPEARVNQVERCNSIAFAEWHSERVEDDTLPADGDEAKELYQGWKKGIQGHLNSCYLDATLFSLFSCCSSADWLLFWPSDDTEADPSSGQAQDLLRCEIVNPLRRYGYVCASKTMALRRLLEAANQDAGFTSQEKDPEEFLNKLFLLLRVEPLLRIRSLSQKPQECHLYQLFPPHVPRSPSPADASVLLPSPLFSPMRVASVQTLLESSFLHAGLKLAEAPSCLLLLMPRFGKDFKMFDIILPTLSLDITDLLDDTLRQCSICQALAQWECAECYEDRDITPGHLKQYCNTCNTQVHSHRRRTSHCPLEMIVPEGTWSAPLDSTRRQMLLFAVTCIETSHYVSFVKHGPLPSDWLFFDSMADRQGGENGFNVPLVRPCPEVGCYLSLSEEELSRVDPATLPERARRLLCDSYMCLYHSPELSLYK